MIRRRGPRAHLAALVAVLVAASATGSLAAAEMPVAPIASPTEAVFNSRFSPKALSKTKPTPVRFSFSARFSNPDEHLPALTELLLRGDKHLRIDVKGAPTVKDVPGCSPGSGPRLGIAAIRKACKGATIGAGRMDVEVQFPDYAPVSIGSELLALNGGAKGGVTTLYLVTYLTAPVTAVVVTTMKIEKIAKGRYGLEAIATLPKIAGGSGSVTRFSLWLKRGIFTATCPDGRLVVDDTAVFSDGTLLRGMTVRTCRPKG